jgi:uncharacterized membrane protein YphA (DoxX/SURF4 family)
LDDVMANSKYQIGTATVIALVALRLGVGWHFYKEGVKKFHDPSFTANVFFEQATGPFSDLFKLLVPDQAGRARLDREQTKTMLVNYGDRVARQLRFDEQQKRQAEQLKKQWSARVDDFYAENAEEINEYFLELQRVQDAKADTSTRDVAFQREWIRGKEAELRGKLKSWSARIDKIGEQYQKDLLALARPEQRRLGVSPVPDRTHSILDTVVKYFITGVGVCLILGLFTRLASLGGAGFLLSVLATQPPWVPGAETSYFYYQLVELLALMVLLTTGAGRFAGLDFFIDSLRTRWRMPEQGDES